MSGFLVLAENLGDVGFYSEAANANDDKEVGDISLSFYLFAGILIVLLIFLYPLLGLSSSLCETISLNNRAFV